MDITEVTTKSALVRSRIPGLEYVINPYTGCGHGCRCCYAVFMGKYSKQHQQAPWGSFVEAKTNIVDVLQGELARKRRTGSLQRACCAAMHDVSTCKTTYTLTPGSCH
jgi:DNA repair photolyase